MQRLSFFTILLFTTAVIWLSTLTGCANIIPPGGGPTDSLPPVLIAATPIDSATQVKTNRITLSFNEFVEIQNALENVVVSPLPNNTPIIDYRLRTVSIRLRDTLEENTTYSINFGNAIKDVNEGNVLKNFIYVFSTGSTVDSNTIRGKVLLAETGKVDSTLIVVLHRNLADTAVAKEKPRYLSKLDGAGNFIFYGLPAGTFALYALPNDYSRQYDDSTKLFAFASEPVNTASNEPMVLYAYNYPKPETKTTTTAGTKVQPNTASADKALRLTTSLEAGGIHDILRPSMELVFNRGIFRYDSASIVLTNSEFAPLEGASIRQDSNRTRFYITYPWKAGTEYNLLLNAEAFADSAGVTLAKNDTINISTKRNEDYGSVKVRFTNLDLTRNPVLQLVQSDKIVESVPMQNREWSRRLFPPGEYELRILYDTNKNGKWDAGSFFGEKRQPEIVQDLKIKLSVRGNWDNEKDITL